MTYPQQPYGQLPQQGYPVQQPGYAPAPQPGYSPPPGYPAPGTAYTPPPQQYPPQGQPPYPPQGQPPQPEVRGTLKDFMDQPSTGGGPSLAFPHPGTSYTGTVVRNVTDADVVAATDMITGAVATYNDRRPKLVMKVPLLLHAPHPAFPEGIGVWYVKGNDRAELARAMEAAGAEPGAPQAGDVITITYTHDQPGRRGMNPSKIKRVDYVRGNGVPPQLPQQSQAYGQAPAPQPQPQSQAYGQAPAPQPQPQYSAAPQYQTVSGQLPPAPQPGQPQQPYAVPSAAPQYGVVYNPAQAQMPIAQQFPPTGMPDPNLAYQAATGQPMPGYPTQPGAPMATSAPTNGAPVPGGYAPPTGAPAAQPQQTAQPTGPAFPSDTPAATRVTQPIPFTPQGAIPGGPPPNWPADVPFIPNLTPAQARIAATMNLPAAGQ